MQPTYSICMCNYNMADTLEQSLVSVLDQLDNRFEVVIVDDGSSDNSVEVIEKMQQHYPMLRLVKLKRDRKRKLGLTRNISIQEARGEYVLLHLDCDDVWQPYLADFTSAFHQVEKCIGRDIFLCGAHVHMGKRDFLLAHGPFENIYRGEDRNLWVRMAGMDAYIPFEHEYFFRRLPKPMTRNIGRTIYNTWDHLVNDFRSDMSLFSFLGYELAKWGGDDMTWKLRMLRLGFVVPAWLTAKFYPQLKRSDVIKTPEDFLAYRNKMRGTFTQILNRYGCEPDFSIFSNDNARRIFSDIKTQDMK